MKVREVLQVLRQYGAEPVRTKGSHQQWRLPNGKTMPIPVNHKSVHLSGNVFMSVRRSLIEAGLPDLKRLGGKI